MSTVRTSQPVCTHSCTKCASRTAEEIVVSTGSVYCGRSASKDVGLNRSTKQTVSALQIVSVRIVTGESC